MPHSVVGAEDRNMDKQQFVQNPWAIKTYEGIRVSVHDLQGLFKCIITAAEPGLFPLLFLKC